MADYVQHALEEMIPELEELQASGIFTKVSTLVHSNDSI